jgi:hypothetical protein
MLLSQNLACMQSPQVCKLHTLKVEVVLRNKFACRFWCLPLHVPPHKCLCPGWPCISDEFRFQVSLVLRLLNWFACMRLPQSTVSLHCHQPGRRLCRHNCFKFSACSTCVLSKHPASLTGLMSSRQQHRQAAAMHNYDMPVLPPPHTHILSSLNLQLVLLPRLVPLAVLSLMLMCSTSWPTPSAWKQHSTHSLHLALACPRA